MGNRTPRGARGFTLVELLVALAIVGLTLAVVTPRLLRLGDERALRAEVQQVQRVLALARSQAISTRTFVAVEFDLQVYPLPDRVRVLQNAEWNAALGRWLGQELQGFDTQVISEPLDVRSVKAGETSYLSGVHAIVFSPAGTAGLDDGSEPGSLDIELLNMNLAA